MIAKTLLTSNQFQFNCPIFRVDTRIAACIALRDKVYRGESVEVRNGCQCAMRASKCPVTLVVDLMVRENTDPYYSAEPRVGSLEPRILDKISVVLVPDNIMKRFPLSAVEEQRIAQANEDARDGKRIVTKRQHRAEEALPDVLPAALPAAKTDTSSLMKAAQSGDMTAAINAATSE